MRNDVAVYVGVFVAGHRDAWGVGVTGFGNGTKYQIHLAYLFSATLAPTNTATYTPTYTATSSRTTMRDPGRTIELWMQYDSRDCIRGCHGFRV